MPKGKPSPEKIRTQFKTNKELTPTKYSDVFKFLDPDEVDRVMITKIKNFGAAKGNQRSTQFAWTEEELIIRNAVVLDYICKQGLSRYETAKQLVIRWGINISTADRYVRMAIDSLARFSDEDMKAARDAYIEQLDNIINSAIEQNRLDTALKALKQKAETQGLVVEQKEVKITDIPIKFKFGQEE